MNETIWNAGSISQLRESLTKVRDNRRFWPDEETMQLAHQIIPVPATEVAIVRDGKLLMQYRTFEEWPSPYNRPGWYIMGGYVPWIGTLHDSCIGHFRKDLKNEYRRFGINFDTDSVTLSEPLVTGEKKWMPGEHPFGCPLSLVCVCELEGNIVETDRLKWSDETIETAVPHHQKFQKLVFAWMRTSEEFKDQQRKLAYLLK